MTVCYGCPPPAYVKDLTSSLEKYIIKSITYKEIALFVMAVTGIHPPDVPDNGGVWR